MEAIAKTLRSQVSRLAVQKSITGPSSLCGNGHFSTTSTPKLNKRTELNYEELSDLLTFDDHQVALIDVRSPNELATYGSIPGAINIPLGEVKAALQLPDHEFHDAFFLPKPSKNAKNLIFFARGPNASSAAVEIAHKLGYKGSRQYAGGWEDYCNKTGLPLKKRQWASYDAKISPFMGRASFEAYKTYSM